MNISVNKNSKTPIYLQLAAQIKTSILEGELLGGFPLLSERSLADLAGVHRNTVRRAYAELEAAGLIESQQGLCYRVIRQQEGAERKTGKTRGKKVNWTAMIKEEYLDMELTFDTWFSKTHQEGMISFAGGITSPELYPEEEVAGVLAEILTKGKKTTDFYTPYQGAYGLRTLLAEFMRGKGVKVSPWEIQIFSETNQAIDFLVTLLLKPGDAVITEEPVSPDVHRAIALAGGEVVTVPIDQDGMICQNMETLIEHYRPKLIYVNSSYNDPTGMLLSLERRQKLLDLSYQYRIPIIEEDAASEITLDGKRLPPIKALDKLDNVIYIHSFELTFVPGLSLAFVAGAKPIISSLGNMVSVRLVNLDWVMQKLLESYLKKGLYQQKLVKLREEYGIKRDLMCRWLDLLRPYGVTYRKPDGGVYVWCQLPETINAIHFAKAAAAKGVAFIPGKVFYPNKNGGDNFIRLNYSYSSKEQIDKGMQIFLNLLKIYMK